MIKKILMSTLLVFGMSSAAQAEMISTDYLNLNDGLATLDTQSGLEWLDVSYTDALSINSVEARFSSDLSGWRLPTHAEITTLFANFFPEVSNTNLSSISTEQGAKFRNLFGYTHKTTYSLGWYERDGILRRGGVYSNTLYGAEYTANYDAYRNIGSSAYGTFLVSGGGTTFSSINNSGINVIGFTGDINAAPEPEPEVSVPAPATLMMFGLGLIGLSASSRKKKAV